MIRSYFFGRRLKYIRPSMTMICVLGVPLNSKNSWQTLTTSGSISTMSSLASGKFIQAHWPDVKLDIVEIDPDVVKVCQEWFEFKPGKNTRIITMDGRLYMKNATDTYDVILLDAYAGDRIPFHMTTKEFVTLVKSRLKPGALSPPTSGKTPSTASTTPRSRRTRRSSRRRTLCTPANSGNVIIFGTLDDKPVTRDDWVKHAAEVTKSQQLGFDLAAIVLKEGNCITNAKNNEKALTDDMAPVETLRRENPKTFEEEQTK